MVETTTTDKNETRRFTILHKWQATQVRPRPVKSGLGGHEAGVSVVEDRVERVLILLMKWRQTVPSNEATFGVFLVGDGKQRRESKRFSTSASEDVSMNRPFMCVVFMVENE